MINEELLSIFNHAPQPDKESIDFEHQKDGAKNPHNESHKPPIRGAIEISIDLRIKYAVEVYNKLDKLKI